MNIFLSRVAHLVLLVFVTAAVHAAPHDVMLIVDNSGSMRKIDPQKLARKAAAEFLQNLPEDFRAGVIIFDQNARLAAPLTPATADGKTALAGSLGSMNYRGPFTDSPAAIERAIFELKTNARPDALKTIVFVSDGVVDTGVALRDAERAKWLREELTAEAASAGIRIMPIAFTENADLLLIDRLAEITGGQALRAVMPADLSGAYQQLLERLRAPPAAAPAAVPTVPEAAPPPVSAPAAPAATETVPVPAAEATPPAATAPPAPEPAPSPAPPAVAATPEAAAPPAAGPAVTLTAEERAALEQLAKDTGVPVEQLMKELENAPSGQPVVVPPEDMVPAPQGPAPATNGLLLGAAVVGLMLAGIAWFFLRGRRAAGGGAAAAAVAVASTMAPAASRPKLAEAFLIDVHGITSEAARRIASDRQLIVGRTAGSDTEHLDYFVVNKATIGRRHAIIKFKDMAFWLVDQGSVNGTFVNNERVLGERMLKHGDRVKFHKFEFEFSYPDMADSTRTVVGITGDQTIVAAQDATLSAAGAALRQDDTPFVATAKTAAVAAGAAATSAWLNKDAFSNVPGSIDDGDPFDVTKEGDLDSLESDREAFFSGSGSQPAYSPPAALVADGDDTFDDEAAATVALAGMRSVGEPAGSVLDFEADASAFFDDGTVGPAPDLLKGPSPELDAEIDVLDITSLPPGVGDDDETSNYVPPGTVMMSTAEGAGTRPPLDTGKFGEFTTVVRDPSETVAPGLAADDFIETGTFGAPATLLPESPAKVASQDVSAEDFVSTGMFEAPELDKAATKSVSEDIFDVTGEVGDIPNQDTVVLNDSPLHAKKPGTEPSR